MSEELLIRFLMVVIVALWVLYQFGYSDRFPYIGKNKWRNRPFYPEIYQILLGRVERFSNGAPVPPESLERLEKTVDMVLSAFGQNHESVEVNLPQFDCGLVVADIHYKITKDEVVNTIVKPKDPPL